MSDLSKFSKEEVALIVSVPYRIGVWISQVDDNARSSIDDAQERKSIAATIEYLSSQSKKMPFGAMVMAAIIKNRSMWSKWGVIAQESQVLADVQKAIELCQEKQMPEAILKQYKFVVWQMAVAVASAFDEGIDPDNEMHVDRFFQWIGSKLSSASIAKNPENLSEKEKMALNKLRAILKE